MFGNSEGNVKLSRTSTTMQMVWETTDGQNNSTLIVPTPIIGSVAVYHTRKARIISANILSGSASAKKVYSQTNRGCPSTAKSGDKPLLLFSGSPISTIKTDSQFGTYKPILQRPFSSILSSAAIAIALIHWAAVNRVNSFMKKPFMLARMKRRMRPMGAEIKVPKKVKMKTRTVELRLRRTDLRVEDRNTRVAGKILVTGAQSEEDEEHAEEFAERERKGDEVKEDWDPFGRQMEMMLGVIAEIKCYPSSHHH